MKKKITIRFIGSGYQDKYQPFVKIYDIQKNCIYKGYTYNGTLNICLKTNEYYYIYACLNSGVLNKVFFVSSNINCYSFIFSHAVIKSNKRLITFILTDQYYQNLPIENGEVILWQRQ